MKSLLITVIMALGLSSTALAFPDAAEMQENFGTCAQMDENFMNNFGRYLVSFDLGEAADICNADTSINGPAQVMACRFNGQWLYAGYYCTVAPN